MLIKFFSHGRGAGAGAGAVNYVTRTEGREHEPPEVLRGDPEQTRDLIDSIDRQWRYTSGVVSFSREDAPSVAEQEKVMDDFEATAFAGLESDQYDCLWVRHAHTDGGRIELHFVTPRMELSTGKALNIAPPGWSSLYGPLRDALNYEHGWARPDDPDRARSLQLAHENLERGHSRETINAYVEQLVETGVVENRAGIVQALEEAGFAVPRQGDHYITVHDAESDERFRLKGGLYEQDWTRAEQLERAVDDEAVGGPRADRAADLERAAQARHELGERLAGRVRAHQERYRSGDAGDDGERAKALAMAALDRSDLHDFGRDLTDDAVGRQLVDAPGFDRAEGRDAGPGERLAEFDGQDRWGGDPFDHGRDVRRPAEGHEFDHDLRMHEQPSLPETAEVIDHGPTDPARTRIDALRERVAGWVSAGHERVTGWLEHLRDGFEQRFGGPVYGDRDRAELFGSALGDHRGASARHAGETERGLEVMRSADENLRGAGRELTRCAETVREMTATQERERALEHELSRGRERDHGWEIEM